MMFVQSVVVNGHQVMGIYKLSLDIARKHKKGFLLSSDVLSDFYLAHKTEEEIISELRPHFYEGLFETQMEAYLTAKLVAASSELDRLSHAIENLKSINVNNIIW